MKNRWIIIPITLLCLGRQVSVDAADVSQPFTHQELQNQAKEIGQVESRQRKSASYTSRKSRR